MQMAAKEKKGGCFELVELEAGVYSLVFDLPGEKVNKLNAAVMTEFESILGRLEKISAKLLILQSGKKSQFIAGADIEMLQATQTAEVARELSARGQALMNRWEDLPFPTVAAVNGPALGGGFEFSLACTAIVASANPSLRVGLPEVLLGLVPGMGGCVRLPRKVGLAQALDLILTGKTLSGERAFKAGLIEAVLPEPDFERSVLRWALQNLPRLQKIDERMGKEPKLGGMGGLLGSLLEKNPVGRRVILKQARQGVLSKTRGQYPAPLAALDLMVRTGAQFGPRLAGKARESSLAVEAEVFGQLVVSDVSRNLVRLFFLTETVKKTSGVPGVDAKRLPVVREVGVLGAGVMGGGIAQLIADRGMIAQMKDLTVEALQTGVAAATKVFQGQLRKKRINKREYLQKLGRIAPTLQNSSLKQVDVVIEAIVENLEVKKKVLADLEGSISGQTVVASNTSSLSISQMQSALKRPENFVGMHFFNPVHKMPLVEVIRGEKSSDLAVATVFELSKRLGKTPIVVKDAPGFLVNRLLAPYLNEASYLLADGVPVEEIDRALLQFGMPMGPMELIDEIGVDVAEKVAHILNDAFGARLLACPLNAKLLASKRLGKKSGRGLYLYSEQNRKKYVESDLYALLGLTPKAGAIESAEMVDRCILPMINEATRCLEESVVATASEVDLGMIMGTGFPPFRGGLLRYADSMGVPQVVERLQKLEKRFGARFEPAPALLKRAQNQVKFYP